MRILVIGKGGRVVGTIATGADIPSAISKSLKAAENIRFKGRHFRRDMRLSARQPMATIA